MKIILQGVCWNIITSKTIRLISVDLTRKKELDVDPTAIQQIESVGQLKKLHSNGNATHAGNDQSMFF